MWIGFFFYAFTKLNAGDFVGSLINLSKGTTELAQHTVKND